MWVASDIFSFDDTLTVMAELYPLPVRLASRSHIVQHVHIKTHPQDGRQLPAALFVCGLPFGLSEQQLTSLFSCFGEVEQAVMHPSRRSAMVAFENDAAITAAIQAAKDAMLVELPETPSDDRPTGLKAWVQAHKARHPGLDVLQEQLDSWTEAHEAEEAAQLRAQQEAMADDGWTVVTRSKGRKRTKESSGVVSQSGGVALAAAQAMAATRKVAVADDFYKFQQRDRRRNELLELRTKFEEDRKRIQQIRATRNFKPL